MPEHMKNGPRKYSEEYNYKQAFNYFDSMKDVALLSEYVDDNHNETTKAHLQDLDDLVLKIAGSKILNQAEDELQRIHHGQNWLQNDDVWLILSRMKIFLF